MIKRLLQGTTLCLRTTLIYADVEDEDEYAIVVESKGREIPILHEDEPKQWCDLLVAYKGGLYPIKKRFHLPIEKDQWIILEE